MAVGYLGTASLVTSSVSASTLDLTHTVTTGTTCLILSIPYRGNMEISSVEVWDTGQAFTLVSAASPVNGNDMGLALYALVSPTAQTNTITITFDQSNDPTSAFLANFDGTVTTSVAAAVQLLELVEEDAGSNTTPFSSAGTAGNGLFICAGFIGNDGDPASNNASFVEIVDTDTGGTSTSNRDHSIYGAYLLDAAPTAVTIDWAGSEAPPGAGIYVELIASTGGSTTSPYYYYAQQ